MVGSVPQSLSLSQPQPPPPPPSAEEEALRRNTDCVYFLASPLTCKKGSECEYRHSDVARINPRDCRFWLHGNCLNPKCAFRHPPLDGLLGTQTPTSAGLSPHVPPNVAASAPSPSTKQGVPCIFFQKGFCLKGDWCPFIHLPNSVSNKALLVTGTSSSAEPVTTIKRAAGGRERDNSVQGNKALPMNVAKPVKNSLQAKSATEVQSVCPRDDFSMNRKALQMPGMANYPAFKTVPPVSKGDSVTWSGRVQQPHLLDEPENLYGKDAGEVSREPSPGFDVLVDDEGRDSDYYPGEDRYGMPMEHEAAKEYDIDRTDYDSIAAFDDERYTGSLGYDSHDGLKGGQHAWEQHRGSAERISGGFYHERRPHDRPNSLDHVDEFDLRHRLTKHRKPNGPKSVINHHRGEHGDQSRRSYSRDEKHVPLHENSLSSRLRGRIRLPGIRSLSERDMVRGNGHGRLSPPLRPGISSHPGRIRDRLGSVEETYNNSAKDHKGLQPRRDYEGDNNINFAGPKSLAELKHRKNTEPTRQHTTDQQSLGKRKHLTLDGDANQQSGIDVSFEGPKPLEEILKRKRGETMRTTKHRNSSDQQVVTDDENQEGNDTTKNELDKSAQGQNTVASESSLAAAYSPRLAIPENEEAEDVMPADDQVDVETEVHEPKDGGYDYDQGGGEDYDLYNGENGDGAVEYIEEEEEDDDDDDFAKKMGVVYS